MKNMKIIDMKRFLELAVVLCVAMVMVSCEKNWNAGNDFLDVTPNNISGVWRLESYDNGVKLAEGSYYYIDLVRKDKTFVTYDNLSSMEMRKRTGRFDIVTDGAAVVFGMYDFGQGDWEHRYYVRNLTNDSMVWVATDDESISYVYVRASLPEEWADKEE